jgi:hypothetical protein
MHVTIDLQLAKKEHLFTYITFLFFWDLGFENIQKTSSALYSLRSGLSNEVSLGIPFHLKKNWEGKNKNRSVSGFFTKITYVQVMNFIQKQYHKTSHFFGKC